MKSHFISNNKLIRFIVKLIWSFSPSGIIGRHIPITTKTVSPNNKQIKPFKRIGWLTVVIPAYNASKNLEGVLPILKNYFDKILVGIDSKTTDDTKNICLKFNVGYIQIENSQKIAEPLIWTLARFASTDIVFRLDSDEIPSTKLINALMTESLFPDEFDIIGLSRCWLKIDNNNGKVKYISDLGPDYQWRLFNRNKVAYVSWIHTSGVVSDESRLTHLPHEFFIMHLQRILECTEEIEEKLMIYDRIKKESGRGNIKFYLSNSHERSFNISEDDQCLVKEYLTKAKKNSTKI